LSAYCDFRQRDFTLQASYKRFWRADVGNTYRPRVMIRRPPSRSRKQQLPLARQSQGNPIPDVREVFVAFKAFTPNFHGATKCLGVDFHALRTVRRIHSSAGSLQQHGPQPSPNAAHSRDTE
jgi:hypothetical protein